jgi:glutathione S-transferase
MPRSARHAESLGRRSSFNVQKVMWLVGELGLAHEHIDAGEELRGRPDY